MSDLYAWGFGSKEFEDVSPKTVKKLVTNNDNAEKEEVANALEQFVGKRDYACDDESDAVAVGIAWLIRHGMIDSPFPEKEKQPKRKR